MNFMTIKRIMIETKQSVLKVLEIERQYREALKQIRKHEKDLEELFSDDDEEED